MIIAILTALTAYLTRGKGDRTVLLQEIRQSSRLGPKVAEWMVQNEGKLVGHPQLQPRRNAAASERPMMQERASESGSTELNKSKPASSRRDVGANSVPEFVWHATANPRAAQGVLNGIDPAYLNPNSRFGAAFYVAEQPGTTIAELAHHGVDATHGIRFDLNANAMKVLDLTNPEIAGAWRYKGGPISSATQKIGVQAQEQGFNVIRFYSERADSGINNAVLDNFNEILRPVSVTPVKP